MAVRADESQEWATDLPSPEEGLEPLLDALVARMADVADAAVAAILLAGADGRLAPAAWRGVDGAAIGGVRLRPDDPWLAGNLASGRSTYIADLSLSGGGADGLAARAGLRGVLLGPLRSRGELVGLAGVARAEVRPYTCSQMARFEALADCADVAIDNSTLIAVM